MSVNYQSPPPPFLSEEEVGILKRTTLAKYPEDEQLTFIRICQRTRLDPFTKQIHPTKRFQKVKQADGKMVKVPTLVPVTGIMGLCAVAERTGNYDGSEIHWAGNDGIWKEEWLEADPPAAARCRVYHKHRSRPEVAIARWEGFVGQFWNDEAKVWEVTDFWAKMPDYMLAKCAKAAALRGAFPDQLSNVYIREELESHLTDSEADLDLQEEAMKMHLEEASKAAAQVPPKQKVETEPVAPPPKSSTTGPILPTPPLASPPPLSPTPKVTPMPPAATQPSARESLGEAIEEKRKEVIMGPGGGQDGDGIDMGAPAEQAPWKDYKIKGLRHANFFGRKLGELSQPELKILEEQWIPAVREKWATEANDAQKQDVEAMEAAIAYHKMSRPW